MLRVVVDVAIFNSAISTATIESLRRIFAKCGIPESIVSDNTTVFACEEFQTCSSNTEGILEKNCFRFFTNKSFSFSFTYRITPHTTTGVSPAELLMGRQLRSHSAMQKRDRQKQHCLKKHHDYRTNTVYVCDFPSSKSWLPETLTKDHGSLAFMVNWDVHICDHVISVLLSDSVPHTDDWADDFTPTVSNAPLLQCSSCVRRAPAQPLTSDCFSSFKGVTVLIGFRAYTLFLVIAFLV